MLTIYTNLTGEQANDLKTFCRLRNLAAESGVKHNGTFMVEDTAHNHSSLVINCSNPYGFGCTKTGLLTLEAARNILSHT